VASFLLKQYERAEKTFQEVLTAHPEQVEANFFLGELYRLTDRPADALALLRKAVSLDGSSALYHLRLGMVYLAGGQMENAEKELKTAIEMDPNNAEACVRKGQLDLGKGSTSDAINAFFRALDIDKNYTEVYELLGDAFGQLGDQSKSIRWYREGIEADPEDAYIYFKLSLAQLKVSGERTAIDTMSKAVALAEKQDPPPKWLPEALYRLGAAHESVRSWGAAIKAYERYIQVAPPSHIDRPEVEARLNGLKQ